MISYTVTDAFTWDGPEYLIFRHDDSKPPASWHKRWHLVAKFSDPTTAKAVAKDLNRSLA